MKVSIIIQNRNYDEWLERCIQSIISLDYPVDDYEIIGLDAASTDKSVEIYKKYPQVRLLEVGLVGQARALNDALRIATGNYISWINSDDQTKPNFIKAHLTAFEKNKGVVLAYSTSEEVVEESGTRIMCYTREFPKEKLAEWNFIFQPSTMIKREALLKLGGFDENIKFAFDYKLWCDLSWLGNFVFVDEETTIYSVRPTSWGNTVKSDEEVEANMIREHFKNQLRSIE